MCELEAVSYDGSDGQSIADSFQVVGVDEVNDCHCRECY